MQTAENRAEVTGTHLSSERLEPEGPTSVTISTPTEKEYRPASRLEICVKEACLING